MKNPSRLKRLPVAIRVLFFTLLASPLLLLWAPASPLWYWLLPWALCWALIARPHAFLPLYLVWCAGLAYEAGWTVQDEGNIIVLRGLLIALNLYTGIVFGNKRMLYPLLSRRVRYWRMSQRIEIHLPIYITDINYSEMIPATLVDCSDTGMGLQVASPAIRGIAEQRAIDTRIVVCLRWRGEEFAIPALLVWSADFASGRNFGLRALSLDRMEAFMALVRESWSEGDSRRQVPTQAFRPTGIPLPAMILWAVTLPLMLILPWL
jgi:hypothetical protein